MMFEKYAIEKLDIEVIDGDRGKNYPHKEELFENGYCLFLSANNVTSNGFEFNNNVFIDENKDHQLNNGKLLRNDIVITTRGTVGNVALYDSSVPYDNIRINSGMLIIRCGKGINSLFLYYVLKSNSFYNQIKAIQTGTAQPQLPKSHFLKMQVPLPQYKIQSKIASILKSLDDKIAINNAINKNLLEQVFALYRKMFVETINTNRKTCRAEQYFNISIGKTPPRKNPDWFTTTSANNIVWVSISDMGSSGLFISNSSEYLTKDAVDKFNVVIVPDNTVLLSFKLTVGRVVISDGCLTTNEAIAHFKTENKEINEYLYCYLKMFNFQTMGSTSSIAVAVNSKLIKAMPFIIPTDNELQLFHNFAAPAFEKIKCNLHENYKLTELRDSLLPRLMSGELDVSDIDF